MYTDDLRIPAVFFFLKNGLSFWHVIIKEKLKERERALRKRKEREEQEVERVRSKARRKVAVESYQALLVETIKDAQVVLLMSDFTTVVY